MGKRHRGSRGSSSEENSPKSRNCPPPKTAKMASGGATLTSLPPDLQKLAQLIFTQTKEQQEATVDQLRTMNEKLSTKIDALDAKMSGLSAELSAVRERVGAVESSAEFHETELQNLRKALDEERRARAKTVILAERYSRKPDVIIRGIPFKKDEDCTQTLGNFLTTELHMDLKPTVAVHRLSKPTTTRPNPPILVRFVNFHDRDKLLFEGRKLRGNMKGLAVYEHLPPPLQSARGKLVAERDEVIKNKGKASIVVPPKSTYAVLLVDGREKKRIDAVDLLLNSEDIKPT
ncbi:uncharacterized protein LOC144906186 [Branchiostoma floridae x Branchiostoma belcheri]